MARHADRTARGPAAALAALALCAATAAVAGPAPATRTVTIAAMRFEPQTLAVRPGDRIVWLNRDPFPHTVVSPAGRFRSPQIAPGASWSHVVRQPGVLPYACSLHPTMTAELRVD